jgi:ubiquinone/menaquinone biosynthesis C-methylase UbiE
MEMWERSGLGGLFLDVGTGGSAYTVIEAARTGVIAVGSDISLSGMQAARRLADAQGVGEKCFFVVCNSEQLPFADGAFAATSAIAVLEHVPSDVQALREIARVTRKNGQVFLAVPNALELMPRPLRSLYARHDRRIGHLRHYSASDLTTLCSTVGLQWHNVAYSAHWVKVWQLLVHLGATRLRIDDTSLWWWLEQFDARAAAADNGLHLNVWLERS